jgi:hypothetical protein
LKGTDELLVSKSTDGGLTWGSPIQVNAPGNSGTGYGPVNDDKTSITADPTNPNFVYATWAEFNDPKLLKANSAETMFARSTDGGLTWQPEQAIHTAPGTDFNWGNRIVVLPNGTLIDAFTEGDINNNNQIALTLLRSTDHGQTWSAPLQAVIQEPLLVPHSSPPNALVTDPNTGQGVEAHPMFDSIAMDPTSGNLYAVWIDARFSNFQYNGIAFSMSTDGGFTWSNPIQVNQTPNTVPPLDRQAWNPTVALAANGTVAVTYYDFRNNTGTGGALTDFWLAFAPAPATNPGTWSEVRLTNTSFNLEQAPTRFAGDFVLGDYEGLAAAGNDFVAVWGMPDGSATNQESIFFRDPPAAETDASPPALADGDPAPQIRSFTASPNPVTAGGSVTLTASNLTDTNPGATITQVAFSYIDNSGSQHLLGYAAQTSPGVWTLSFSPSTFSLTSGTYTLLAQAEDSYGVFSDPFALTLTVQ